MIFVETLSRFSTISSLFLVFCVFWKSISTFILLSFKVFSISPSIVSNLTSTLLLFLSKFFNSSFLIFSILSEVLFDLSNFFIFIFSAFNFGLCRNLFFLSFSKFCLATFSALAFCSFSLILANFLLSSSKSSSNIISISSVPITFEIFSEWSAIIPNVTTCLQQFFLLFLKNMQSQSASTNSPFFCSTVIDVLQRLFSLYSPSTVIKFPSAKSAVIFPKLLL